MRLDVCRCFLGRSLSAVTIASIIPVTHQLRPKWRLLADIAGGTENFIIFETFSH